MYITSKSKFDIYILLLSECITSSDCPGGGTNFICNGNKCECQSPNVLEGDKCVGKFHLTEQIYVTMIGKLRS